ncbi:hypothetical protein ANCCAN_20646 [Ancylostoma caninum]|uniref:Uncharacterized protein n=1 Tax=Ancylostoma caninum TaxID=29170 RepID=A0A368FRR6_ANCCA|nr:hypothetical protein ANCCAN_20646 [Ancylostoma caninum]
MSHTVSSTCNVPFYDRPQTPLSLLPFIENAQAHTLVKDEEGSFTAVPGELVFRIEFAQLVIRSPLIQYYGNSPGENRDKGFVYAHMVIE